MRDSNIAQFSAYSVVGTVTLMPLLVLPAMVGMLVASLIVGASNYQRVFVMAIALFVIGIGCFMGSERRTRPTESAQ